MAQESRETITYWVAGLQDPAAEQLVDEPKGLKLHQQPIELPVMLSSIPPWLSSSSVPEP